MPVEITMPQLSDTMTEGKVIKWLKKEGEKVSSGDKVAEVETDKAVMEMESFASGTLAAILAKEGDKVAVGAVLAVVATGKEDPAEVKKLAGSKGAGAPAVGAGAPAAGAGAAGPVHQGHGSGEMREGDSSGHPAMRTQAVGAAVAAPPAPPRSGNGDRRVRISPLARRIAADRNVDIKSLQGSGPDGRIVKKDVLTVTVTAPAAVSLAPARLGSGEKQIVPLSKMRLAIAKNLQASTQTIPHFYETVEADVEELSAMRVRLNEVLEPQKIRLSLGDFIAKAIAMSLLAHPAVNATFNGTEVTRYGDVHLGMAVAIPDGLIVPVLRNVHLMGLKEIRQRSVDLVDRARAQRLRQEEMSGATFTVSNLGAFGIKEFTAIINPPQVAILAVGAAEKRPAFKNGQIVGRTMMNVTLSADHRVIVGATAAEFLRTLKSLLEEPGMMLVFA
jgi:pyruvate dehydrogenase E2 component (dihydrolipoamide acetyltransferase)